MTKEQIIVQLRKGARECEEEHAMWIKRDRKIKRVFTFVGIMFLISATMNACFISIPLGIFQAVVAGWFLFKAFDQGRDHSTRDFLVIRQAFLDKAKELEDQP